MTTDVVSFRNLEKIYTEPWINFEGQQNGDELCNQTFLTSPPPRFAETHAFATRFLVAVFENHKCQRFRCGVSLNFFG